MSGLRDIPADESSLPHVYAKRVAYLGCPHKVRAATLNYFGRAPSLRTCERIVAERARERAGRPLPGPNCTVCKGPVARDNKSKMCLGCIQAAAKGKATNGRPVARRCECGAKIDRDSATGQCRACLYPGGNLRVDQEAMARGEAIVRRAAEMHGMTVADLRGGERTERYVTARHMAMAALRRKGFSFPIIAKLLRRNDHTTARYGAEKAEWFAERDQGVADIIAELVEAA